MASPDSAGLRLRSYQILTGPDGALWELGSGSFGRTFRARHVILGTAVALKIVHDHLSGDSRIRTRFLREAREQARMEHPNIAAITYCDEVDGTMFYVMELCEGGDLKRLVDQRGALTPAETMHVMLHAAEALQFAHGRGFIHRDLKPSSLLLVFDADGVPVVKLTDFGLGKTTGGSTEMTTGLLGLKSDKSMTGSPEEARNEPLDARSDLFSLGMTAWYLLAGGPPVPGKPAEILSDRLSDEEYGPRLPGELTGLPRQILTRLLRKNPADRYPSAAALLVDLRECAAAMPVPIRDWHIPPDPAGMPAAPAARPEPEPPRPVPEPSGVSRTECRQALADALRAIAEAEQTTSAILETVAAAAEAVPEAREPLEMLRHWTDRVPRWRAECQTLLQEEPATPDSALTPAVERASTLARQAQDATGQTLTWAKRVESEVRRAGESRRRADQLRQLEGALREVREPVRTPPPAETAPRLEEVPAPEAPERDVWQQPVVDASPVRAGTGKSGPVIRPQVPSQWRTTVAIAGGIICLGAGAAWQWWPEGDAGSGTGVTVNGGVQPDVKPDVGPDVKPDGPETDNPDPPPPPPPAEFAAAFFLTGDLPEDLKTIRLSGLTQARDLSIEPPSTIRGAFREAEGAAFSIEVPPGFEVTAPSAPALRTRVDLTVARTAGTVRWSPPENSPYSRLEFGWQEPLAGEGQVRPAERVVIAVTAGSAVLPTGIWNVSADDGVPGHDADPGGTVIEARPIGRIEVRKGEEVAVGVPEFPALLEGFGFITPGRTVLTRAANDGVRDRLRKFEQSARSPSRRDWCRLATWDGSNWRYPSRVRAGWAAGEFFLEFTDYQTAFTLIPTLYAIVRGCELNRVRNFPLTDIKPPGAFDDPAAAYEAIRAGVESLDGARVTRLPRELQDSIPAAQQAWKAWVDPKHRGTAPGELERLSVTGGATLTLRIDVQGEIRPVTLLLTHSGEADTWSLTGGDQGFEEIEAILRPAP